MRFPPMGRSTAAFGPDSRFLGQGGSARRWRGRRGTRVGRPQKEPCVPTPQNARNDLQEALLAFSQEVFEATQQLLSAQQRLTQEILAGSSQGGTNGTEQDAVGGRPDDHELGAEDSDDSEEEAAADDLLDDDQADDDVDDDLSDEEVGGADVDDGGDVDLDEDVADEDVADADADEDVADEELADEEFADEDVDEDVADEDVDGEVGEEVDGDVDEDGVDDDGEAGGAEAPAEQSQGAPVASGSAGRARRGRRR